MAADKSQYEIKVNRLLDAILTPDFQLKNDCYLNSLLTHFSGKVNKELGEELLHLPITIEWVIRAVTHWEIAGPPSTNISSFVLNLIALLSKDENIFAHYIIKNVYQKVFKVFKTTTQSIHPSTKLSYVKILSSFLEHQSGTEWITSNDMWKDCLNFSLANETIYIIREGHNFIYNLLVKTVANNEAFTNSVVHEIIGKLQDNLCIEGNLFPEIEDEILRKRLRPTVTLINFILDKLIHGDLYKNRDYTIANIFIKQNLEVCINKVIVLTRHADFLYDLYNILFTIYFFEIVIHAQNELFDAIDVCNLGKRVLGIINNLISTAQVVNVVKLCHLADSHWNLLQGRLPPVEIHIKGEPLLFQNQLVALQIMPVFGVGFVHCNYQNSVLEEDDVREAFIEGIFNMMFQNTIRMGYNWRNVLMEQSDVIENGKMAILYAIKNIKNYDKRRGITVFKVFLYALKDVTQTIRKKPTNIELFTRNVGYCITLLEAVAIFIAEFEITWRESFETICVNSITTEFLNHPIWPPRVVVQGLKLIKLTIARFLSPNLALLIETNKNDTTMDPLGNMVIAKLHDIHWEVRDSALEIVHTIANISNTKYPSFQRLIMNLDIISLVITMSTSDTEGFVRASAIKCLQEMIQVQKFWTQVLVNKELPKKMMYILRTETEAIVRTEAAALMRYIHEYQSFPVELMDEIYECMVHAATSDLHWEVKSNALDFWGKVILNHLQDQGFIDGKFPTVTFSKENRKIVTLTESEIKARLSKVLLKLSQNGCLSVLVNAIQDDCDIEVAKKSLVKTKKLTRILDMYNIFSLYPNTPPKEPSIIENNLKNPTKVSSDQLSDEVIDQIINTQDVKLLESVYNPDFPKDEIETHRNLRIVSPEMFVAFVQTDLDSLVLEKTMWLQKLENLNSLLDDMLQSYEDNVNTMDCY